jgi:hypothetical protein
MKLLSSPRLFATTSALAGAIAIGATSAPAESVHAAAAKITPSGVDGVKVGATYSSLRSKGLVGKIRKGCELGGPNTRSAPLRPPLNGGVDFTLSSPRKVTNITLSGGATARGVGVGGTIPQIKAAYPKAKVDHSTDTTFGITLVKIPKNGGGAIQFAVDTKTHKITLIGVPFIAFCE